MITHVYIPLPDFLHGDVHDPLYPTSVGRPNIMDRQEHGAISLLIQVPLKMKNIMPDDSKSANLNIDRDRSTQLQVYNMVGQTG